MGRNLNDIHCSWRVAGASVIGVTHEQHGCQCEDAWCFFRGSNKAKPELVAACVCDGAGSAANGAIGAQLVSWAVASWLVDRFSRLLMLSREEIARAAVAIAMRYLHRRARRQRQELASYACTVLAVVAEGENDWLALHLGDGAIAACLGASVRPVSLPAKGEYANETFFITGSDAAEQIRVYGSRFDGGGASGFAIFTDGLEHLLVNRHSGVVASALAKMLGWLDSHKEDDVAAALRRNIRDSWRDSSGDDCTLVILRKTDMKGD
jgi:hypothetical protein